MTGTTGTGDEPKLTPLNLMLVTLRLPDDPVEDPEPEPAEAGLFGAGTVGAYDLTGLTANSRFQDIAGTIVSTDRIGRARDLSGNGLDIYALSDAGRPKAEVGFALQDDYNEHRLASDAITATGAGTYIAIRFRQLAFDFFGNHLVGPDSAAIWDQGNGNFRILGPVPGGTVISAVSQTSGDHTIELWGGSPARYALDGGTIEDAVESFTEGFDRLVIGGRRVTVSQSRAWMGRIYRVVVRDSHPSDEKRAAILNWLNNV
jgi:hypothetical protein